MIVKTVVKTPHIVLYISSCINAPRRFGIGGMSMSCWFFKWETLDVETKRVSFPTYCRRVIGDGRINPRSPTNFAHALHDVGYIVRHKT